MNDEETGGRVSIAQGRTRESARLRERSLAGRAGRAFTVRHEIPESGTKRHAGESANTLLHAGFDSCETGRTPHLPAFGVRADSGDSGMMVKRLGAFGDKEFPKNSIKLDKFTGYFDKLTMFFRK